MQLCVVALCCPSECPLGKKEREENCASPSQLSHLPCDLQEGQPEKAIALRFKCLRETDFLLFSEMDFCFTYEVSLEMFQCILFTSARNEGLLMLTQS